MIPKKVTVSKWRKVVNYVTQGSITQGSIDKRIAIRTANSKRKYENSVSRFGEESAERRKKISKILVENRLRDAGRHVFLWWNVSFNSSLRQTNLALGVDLTKLVREYAPNGRVLEIGCGDGTTITQLQKAIPTTKFSALGLTIPKEWMKHENYKEIDWHVAHAGKLSSIKRTLPPGSVNLAFSTLGLTHAPEFEKSLQEAHTLLKPGGHLLFNLEKQTQLTPIEFKKMGFELIWKKPTEVEANSQSPFGTTQQKPQSLTAYFLKKI